MNEQLASLIRTIIKAAGGALVLKGIGDAALWEAVAGSAAILVPAVWSYFSHNPNSSIV